MRVLPFLLLVTAVSAADRPLDLALAQFPLKEGVTFVEGTRGLGDAFPYVEGLAPATLHKFAGPIRDTEEATAAVRVYLAGPLVRTEAQAHRLVATAQELRKECKHLPPRIEDHRPEGYAPTAKAVDGGFEVSLVAFEMDRNLQLVHVTAKVTADGKIKMQRHVIVDGPMTSWQTATLATDDAEGVARAARTDQEMHAEATLAWKRYARALRPERDLETAWAIARLAPTMRQIEDLWGKPDWDGGSGLVIRRYDLADGTQVMFGAPGWDRACVYIRHMKKDKALHTLYTR